MDDPYISLNVGYIQSVSCYFEEKDVKLISALSKGDRVTIIGVCGGFTLTNVVVQDCELWK